MSNKKNKVLEVATNLFIEKGFANTSISQICDDANVSKGLIYHHFKSKNSILIEIFSHMTLKMIEMNENLEPIKNPNKQLINLINSIFLQLNQEKKIFQFNLNMIFQPTTRIILKEHIEKRATVLYDSVKLIFDKISLERSEVLSYMFIAEIDGISLSYLSSFNKYPLELMKKELIKKYKN